MAADFMMGSPTALADPTLESEVREYKAGKGLIERPIFNRKFIGVKSNVLVQSFNRESPMVEIRLEKIVISGWGVTSGLSHQWQW